MTGLTRESSGAPLDTTSGLDISGGRETVGQGPNWRGMDRQRMETEAGKQVERIEGGRQVFGQRDEGLEGGRGGIFESCF